MLQDIFVCNLRIFVISYRVYSWQAFPAWGRACTFYSRNLRIFVLSYSVCPWQATATATATNSPSVIAIAAATATVIVAATLKYHEWYSQNFL